MMKRPTIATALLFFLSPLSAVNQSRVTQAEARRLVTTILPGDAARDRGLTVELDHEHDQCAVYHAFRMSKPPSMALTLGWWSIDNRTAEVWDDLRFEHVTNQAISAIPRGIRKRLGVTDDEVLRSISRPCYQRDSK
jgi:hypothetical protein